MEHIGKYDHKQVYKLRANAGIPQDTENLYVKSNGDIYFGGVRIGRLNPATLKVLSYDMEIWSKAQREEREKAKEEEKKSESASSLCDNDEFFSLLAKEIEDVLASARNDAFGS
jgi:hypothetical protein